LQDAWAEVEHELLYKAEFTPFDEPVRRRLAAVNASLSLVDSVFQEIREYQRRLQDELVKRRQTISQKIVMELPLPEEPMPLPEAEEPGGFEATLVEINDALLLEALTAHNKRRYQDAIAIYSRLLARRPKNSLKAIIYIHRGMAFFGSSRYDEALGDFASALQIDGKNVRALYYRGVVYRFLQDIRRALSDFDRALELDPYQFDAALARAQVYYNLGDYIKAGEDCGRALALRPDDERAKRLMDIIKDRMQF